jgi:hypothetical protein
MLKLYLNTNYLLIYFIINNLNTLHNNSRSRFFYSKTISRNNLLFKYLILIYLNVHYPFKINKILFENFF